MTVNTEHTAGTSASTLAALDHLVKQQKPYVLAINGGSSSIKFALYQKGDPPKRQLHGKVDRIGSRDATLTFDDLERNQQDMVNHA